MTLNDLWSTGARRVCADALCSLAIVLARGADLFLASHRKLQPNKKSTAVLVHKSIYCCSSKKSRPRCWNDLGGKGRGPIENTERELVRDSQSERESSGVATEREPLRGNRIIDVSHLLVLSPTRVTAFRSLR